MLNCNGGIFSLGTRVYASHRYKSYVIYSIDDCLERSSDVHFHWPLSSWLDQRSLAHQCSPCCVKHSVGRKIRSTPEVINAAASFRRKKSHRASSCLVGQGAGNRRLIHARLVTVVLTPQARKAQRRCRRSFFPGGTSSAFQSMNCLKSEGLITMRLHRSRRDTRGYGTWWSD